MSVPEALRELATRRPLLVALDFDGVLAPIVERAPDARALPGTTELVTALAEVPDVVVALVSGRARDDLVAVSGLGGSSGSASSGGASSGGLSSDGGSPGPDGSRASRPVLLVGSHGAEVDGAPPPGLDAGALERLEQVLSGLRAVARAHLGAEVEVKPSAGVLHTRRVARSEVEQATREALEAMGRLPDVHVTQGKEVVEVAVTEATKGAAIEALRRAHGVAAVLYVGDDVTDETVFRSLGPDDLGVKVGEGETAARERVADPAAVQALLRTLLDLLTP